MAITDPSIVWRGTESQVCGFLNIAPSPATASTSSRQTTGHGPGSHKENARKAYVFLSEDEEQNAVAFDNVIAVENEVTAATGNATARSCEDKGLKKLGDCIVR